MEIKEILEKIALPCRSNKKGFKDTTRLEAIENLLKKENSDYHIVYKSSHCWIFGKKELEEDKQTLLISSHADIVNNISDPYSDYLEDKKYFQGTYDNLGTNAASVYVMLNEKVPGNVYFAFTADEETGRCNGAWDALDFMIKNTKRRPFVFALDVTDEGYDNNRLFTIEGLNAKTEEFRKKMLEKFLETEGKEQSFEVIRLKKKDDNSFLPESYRSDELTVFDESVFYARANCNSCSLCLPGDGNMHGMSGFFVKEAVMKGYCLSLTSSILAYTSKDTTRLEELKKEKDELIEKAKDTKFHKYSIESHYYGDKFLLENDDNQIPGQLSFSDIDETFFQTSDKVDIMQNPYALDELIDEIYDFAICYDESQFSMFYEDVLYSYNLKATDTLRDFLASMFNEVHDYERN